LEADHATVFRDNPPPREGYEIGHDHRDMVFMRSIGLGEEPTLQDLFEFNKDVFEWQEPVEVSESEAFGVPAVAARLCDTEGCEYTLMGFVNDEAFYLFTSAETEEELDAFLPTFEQMVASIASEAGAEPTAEATAEPAASVAGDVYELDETYVIPGFGFSMAIPAGWHADTRGEVTLINELESDHATAFREDPPPREGYQISLDHRDAAFMAGIGLGDDATLQDLLDLNKDFFDWQEPLEVSESEAFGVPALAARHFDGEEWGYAVMGFVNEEAFLLGFGAPSEEALDAFLPTWQQMVASIAPEN
jgi:hypothetical protein